MTSTQSRVAMVIANNYEDIEADSPKTHLESLGAEVTVIGITSELVKGKKGGSLQPDATFADVKPDIVEKIQNLGQHTCYIKRKPDPYRPADKQLPGVQPLLARKHPAQYIDSHANQRERE